MKNVNDVRFLDFKCFPDVNGTLVFADTQHHIPHPVNRIFYIYDVKAGDVRGEHAHKQCQQTLICLKGTCEVMVTDGSDKKVYKLNSARQALHVPSGVWAEQRYIEEGTILLVLTDLLFDEKDYIRNFKEFLSYREKGQDS